MHHYPGSERSEHADRFAQLVAAWDRLRDTASTHPEAVGALARQVVAHRGVLFETNARLQADAPGDDDATMVGAVEANQAAIKGCTTLLTEMSAALGLASIPG